ncbi:MAG: hypothetical protein ACKO3W_07135 [bacterium]
MMQIALIALIFSLFPQTPPKPPTDAPRIPDSVFVDTEPADAKCVSVVKRDAKKGDTVVIAAKIGGRAEPFVKNRAIVIVADRCMKSCDQIPGDTCAKPWDYCCEPPESLKANTMTLQFTGDDGKVLKTGAQGVHGLEPLALVVIEGVVTEKDDKGTFVVRAKRVFVEKPEEHEGASSKDKPASEGASAPKDAPKK